MRLTLSTLEHWGACGTGLDTFETLAPHGLVVEGEPPEELCALVAARCVETSGCSVDVGDCVDWLTSKAWGEAYYLDMDPPEPSPYEAYRLAGGFGTYAAWLAQVKALWRLLASLPEVKPET